ncbi:S-adenosyl-L-methionine-dependent methyltransferase [Zopfochytrium polystomum]|nr:S-adenosyl-L-methionine-dependent methyltransferase [Zopfochytrium polystomum]
MEPQPADRSACAVESGRQAISSAAISAHPTVLPRVFCDDLLVASSTNPAEGSHVSLPLAAVENLSLEAEHPCSHLVRPDTPQSPSLPSSDSTLNNDEEKPASDVKTPTAPRTRRAQQVPAASYRAELPSEDLQLDYSALNGSAPASSSSFPTRIESEETSNDTVDGEIECDLQTPLCHGRVDDLESMVPSDWWQGVFSDELYLKTDGDVVEDADVTREEVNRLLKDPGVSRILARGREPPSGGVSQAATVLDLCCGQGRHALHIATLFPFLKIYGVDLSNYLISLAQERAATLTLPSLPSNAIASTAEDPSLSFAASPSQPPTFAVSDCRQIPHPSEFFDLVILMGNSFGYFSDAGDVQVLRECFRVLKNGTGRLVIDQADGKQTRSTFAERSWEWIDDSTFVCRERCLSRDRRRLISREVITDVDRGVLRDQFYQERLYDRDELEDLLREVGFHVVVGDAVKLATGPRSERRECVAVEYMTAAKTLSKRREDLGMMEHRMIVTAMKPSRT